MLLVSICDVVLLGSLAAAGFLMSALPLSIIGILIGTTALFTLAMDSIKLAVLARLRID
jgi:hypothetical protein